MADGGEWGRAGLGRGFCDTGCVSLCARRPVRSPPVTPALTPEVYLEPKGSAGLIYPEGADSVPEPSLQGSFADGGVAACGRGGHGAAFLPAWKAGMRGQCGHMELTTYK